MDGVDWIVLARFALPCLLSFSLVLCWGTMRRQRRLIARLVKAQQTSQYDAFQSGFVAGMRAGAGVPVDADSGAVPGSEGTHPTYRAYVRGAHDVGHPN